MVQARCSAHFVRIGSTVAALLLAHSALATDRLVPSQYPTIRAAVNASAHGDRIILADGVYSGPDNRDIDVVHRVMIMSASGNPAACIIDCQDLGRAFRLGFGDDLASGVSGITFRDGSSMPYQGGALVIGYIGDTRCTVTNCVFESCRANDGGALFIVDNGTDPVISNCVFKQNSATITGGAIYLDRQASASVVNCIFTDNSAVAQNGGGAILAYSGPAIIRNCTFVNNTGASGVSFIDFGDASFELSNSIFVNSTVHVDSPGTISNCLLPGLPAAPDASGNFGGNPLFVNAAAGNFRLQAGSPAINRGSSTGIAVPPFPGLGPTPLDFDRNARLCGAAVDLGAFEFGGCIPVPPVTNDTCANATLVTSGTYTGSTAAATRDGSASCNPGATAPDVWYRWTASCSTTLEINTCDSSFDTVLSLYTGSCGALTEIACNDDGVEHAGAPCPQQSTTSHIAAPVIAGTTYYIRLSGYNNGSGNFSLAVSSGGSAATCQTPLLLTNGAVNFSTTCAAADQATGCGSSAGSPALWYTYTAPCNTFAIFSTCGSDFDTVLTAFSGTACGSLTEVACNDDTTNRCTIGPFSRLSSYIAFPATAGDVYKIRVSGYNGSSGSGILRAACAQPCPCDWNGDFIVNSQDFFDFLTGFFNSDADYDHSGSTTSQDFFDFLTCFFAGCSL